MQSEFYNVELDRIRYSLVWEDSQTLYDALEINSNDQLLIITSAGCNVLNALLKNPAGITAIDLNPVQNRLLLLKKHIILHHDFEDYHSLLGFKGCDAVSVSKQKLFETLPAHDKNFWTGFLDNHPEGLITSGKLENYITAFYQTLDSAVQQKLCQLITFKEVKEQSDFFMKHLHHSSFRNSFIEYFDDENLSKGRDPRLLKYAEETGGQAFYNRLMEQVRSTLVSTNFYFRFFFFGPENLPEDILPPCYRKENYEFLKEQLNKLQVVKGEAVDYLLSQAAVAINKASLSNIFEYTSHDEFENVCKALAESPHHHLRLVFWNLLNTQGEHPAKLKDKLKLEKMGSSLQSCFYFKNVLLLQYMPVTSSNTTYQT